MSNRIEFKFRELEATDLVPFCSILEQIGVESFSKLFSTEAVLSMAGGDNLLDEETQTKVSIQMMLEFANIIIKNMKHIEEPLFRFLGSMVSMSLEEIKALKLKDLIRLIKELFSNEGFQDFFMEVSELFLPAQ